MQPKISIIIPVYKVEAFIDDCLQSVYSQTYSSIEVVIVDDCSPDKSIEVATDTIQKLRSKFEVQLCRNDKNRGLSYSRNIGVKRSTGDYIYFLDSDDVICDYAIAALVEPIINNQSQIDFIIGAIRTEGKVIRYPLTTASQLNDNKAILSSFMLGQWYVMGVNKLIDRKFFTDNNLWFKEGLLHEDILFSFQLAWCSHSMATVHKDTYIYKIRTTGSITSSAGLKNLKDEQFINQSNFSTLQSQHAANDSLPIYKYCVNCIYVYLYVVAASKSVDKKEKKELRRQALSLFRTMQSYEKTAELSLSDKIKVMIMSLPWMISSKILYLHKKLIESK